MIQPRRNFLKDAGKAAIADVAKKTVELLNAHYGV